LALPPYKQIHKNDDSLIAGHLILDYMDHYGFDYSKYVYMAESALSYSKFKKQISNSDDL